MHPTAVVSLLNSPKSNSHGRQSGGRDPPQVQVIQAVAPVLQESIVPAGCDEASSTVLNDWQCLKIAKRY
jgi:hypothetical protein